MRPEPGQVLHFSEDPSITGFAPHVAATSQQPEAYVWAVDAGQAPSYWFPRDCPRAMAWVVDGTTVVQLRVLTNLWAFFDAVVASSCDFSGIRLRNALPRP